MKPILAADLFCGAGGTSEGLQQAADRLGRRLQLIAINHWTVAIETHTANHPNATHLCESLDSVDPRKIIPGGRLNLLVASPECTHHSNARGGHPMSDQSRASAWHILRWAEALHIENILIENVREFINWGPLTKAGRPMKRKKGHTFKAFLESLRSLGYHVDFRILNAADYGDATTRHRLFIQASLRKKITWPAATHANNWKPARDIIDWTHKGQSIFTRPKPLKEKTLARIMAGLKKFSGESFIIPFFGERNGQSSRCRSINVPLATVTSQGAGALIQPFLIQVNHGDEGSASSASRAHSLDKPMPAMTTKNNLALCEPFVIGQQSCSAPRSVSQPLPTISTAGAIALVEPFLVSYYANGKPQSISKPLATVTGNDRFGLVSPELKEAVLDINFRMLTPRELARAMSFPDAYNFTGTRESQVRQIGNAVPVNLASALCENLIA